MSRIESVRIGNGMAEFKNLKLPIQTHAKIVSRANALGMKKYVLAEILISLGLQYSDREIQEAVVNAQLTQQITDTNPELGETER